MNIAVLTGAFLLGIGGSLHCLGMCGPLAMSLPYSSDGYPKPVKAVLYYLSKALAYGAMGAVMGAFGKGLFLMEWQQGLSVAAGIFVLAWACLPFLKRKEGHFLFQKQFAAVYAKLNHAPRLRYYAVLGFLNGLLPCGMVYAALAIATVSGSVAGGFTAMFLFGLGTAPALLTLVLLKHKISLRVRRQFRPLTVGMSVMVGALLILRGLNLGIPYVSPEVQQHEVHGCCSKH